MAATTGNIEKGGQSLIMSKEEFIKIIENVDISKIKSFTIIYEDYESMSQDKTMSFSDGRNK